MQRGTEVFENKRTLNAGHREPADASSSQEDYLIKSEGCKTARLFGAYEQSIREFCIGKKNWVMIDTVAGANSSAIIYSIAETAKANNLKPYDYFEYLLTEIPKHLNGTNRSFLEDLLPWAPSLPVSCRKSGKNEIK